MPVPLRTPILINQLNSAYEPIVQPALTDFSSALTSYTPMVQARNLLQAEAQTATREGNRLRLDNVGVGAFLYQASRQMQRLSNQVAGITSEVQRLSVQVASEVGREGLYRIEGNRLIPDSAARAAWGDDDLEAMQIALQYGNSPEYVGELQRFERLIYAHLENQFERANNEGWSNDTLIDALWLILTSFSITEAQKLLRTIELNTYRAALAEFQRERADWLERMGAYQVRVAVLDGRTCLACIAMHGDIMEIGEDVLDHHRGRCSSIIVTTGMGELITGEMWWDSLSAEEQLGERTRERVESIQGGEFILRDYIEPYPDNFFGMMLRESSLKRLRRV